MPNTPMHLQTPSPQVTQIGGNLGDTLVRNYHLAAPLGQLFNHGTTRKFNILIKSLKTVDETIKLDGFHSCQWSRGCHVASRGCHVESRGVTWVSRGVTCHVGVTWVSRGCHVVSRGCHVGVTWRSRGGHVEVTWESRGSHVESHGVT
jgi:hypothetical protein